MSEILTKRNNQKFEHEGHLYWFDKLVANGTKKSWRCATETQKNVKCKGRIYTNLDNEFLEVIREHGHSGDAAGVEVARMITDLKRRAIETQEIPSQIRTASSQSLTVAAQGRLPSQNAIRKVIQRVRTDANTAPAQPIDRASIQIPENYQIYENNPGQFENFLLADSGEGDADRILIFGRQSVGNWIEHSQKIYVDGTFSLAPALFSQIFVILASRGEFVLPVCYALLPNKCEETYARMLDLICDTWPNFEPAAISLDFELAIINSFSKKFPEADLQACLFHLVKNMKRKLSQEHLMSRYNTDANFALSARMISALAFVPIEHLETALEALRNDLPKELTPILDYFEDNYIGRMQRNNQRRSPLFSPDIWSCYTRTLENEARTNNYAEAAHRRLQAEFGVDHPTLWKFIDGIRSVQKSIDQIYEQFIRGDPAPMKRNKYLKADARILSIVNGFEEREIIEYLRGIAHNFQMD